MYTLSDADMYLHALVHLFISWCIVFCAGVEILVAWATCTVSFQWQPVTLHASSVLVDRPGNSYSVSPGNSVSPGRSSLYQTGFTSWDSTWEFHPANWHIQVLSNVSSTSGPMWFASWVAFLPVSTMSCKLFTSWEKSVVLSTVMAKYGYNSVGIYIEIREFPHPGKNLIPN